MRSTPALYLIKTLSLLKKLFSRPIKILSLKIYIKNITRYIKKTHFVLYLEITSRRE